MVRRFEAFTKEKKADTQTIVVRDAHSNETVATAEFNKGTNTIQNSKIIQAESKNAGGLKTGINHALKRYSRTWRQ